MNVSDMQVQEEDGYLSRSKTVKANNNKIVKERNWMNLVTSKIGIQPLEPHTDAHLHEESVI